MCGRVLGNNGSKEETVVGFPLLQGDRDLRDTLEPNGLNDEGLEEWWLGAHRQWEATVEANLPIQSLREGPDSCGLDSSAITLLITAGLVEEDLRFGQLFESMQDESMSSPPSVWLFQAWWFDETG